MGPTSGALPSNPPTLSSRASWAGLLGSVPVVPGCTSSDSIMLGYPTSSPVSLEDGDCPWICFSLTFYELDSLLTRVHSEPLYEILCHLTINFETSLSGLFLFLLCGPEFTSDSSVTLLVSHLAPTATSVADFCSFRLFFLAVLCYSLQYSGWGIPWST